VIESSSSSPAESRGAPRRRQITDAALAVLAAEGARGLTHRAVDRAAGLPEGSTSNAYRSRAALMEAALERHVELELVPFPDLGGVSLTPAQTRTLVLAALDHVLRDRTLLIARYELVLESTRREALHDELGGARERFVAIAEQFLQAGGCGTPRAHAVQLVAVLDGLLLDQVLDADCHLDRPGIEAVVDRFLATC